MIYQLMVEVDNR